MSEFNSSLEKLRSYIEAEEFKGYDPYDTLCSPIPFRWLGRWGEVIAIQVQKRNMFNIRPLLGIKKRYNAKAIGLLLEAYVKLAAAEKEESTNEYDSQIQFFVKYLSDHSSKGFHGHCWGYSFPWSTSEKHLPAGAPNVVVTAFVVRGLHAYYLYSGDDRASAMIESAAQFVLNDLPTAKEEEGIYFSYTPFQKDCCYNASLFAAEILARASSLKHNQQFESLAKGAVEFVLHQQKLDGRWNYSKNVSTGVEREQIDFHQGYIIDSILYIKNLLKIEDNRWSNALESGTNFYRKKQFYDEGRSLWRLPKEFPVEIHNQSQGIITFTNMAFLNPEYAAFAKTIARWTIENMQDKSGYFYYRKLKTYTNKISYMRWSNAWMFLAISTLRSPR